ncbi:MAG: hypothetical protein NC406_03370 [Bacteroides sp.]|nr:hypothetical protein [Bacteroides sp.]MCM1095060.1 hypothetical protein [Terasakiella sp.]
MLKNLFLSAALVCACGTVSAAETVLFEGTHELVNFKSATLKVAKEKFAGIASGDVLSVTFTVGSAENYGTVQLCYGTTKMACDSEKTGTKADGNFAADATFTNAIVTSATDIAGLQKSGLQIKGKNVTITKVTLGGDGSAPVDPVDPVDPVEPVDPVKPGEGETALWTGTVDTGKWSTDVTVEPDKFAPYKGGDILAIYLSVNAGAEYGKIELDDIDYTQLMCDESAPELDNYGCIQPGTGKLTYIITNSDMELLKAAGLRVKGTGVTVTMITISEGEALPDDPAEQGTSILWRGNLNCGKWSQSVSVPAEKFADAAEGDLLIIKLSHNTGKGPGQIKLSDGASHDLSVNGKGTNMDASGTMPNDVADVTFTLPADDVALLKADGLKISGSAVTLSRVTLKKSQGAAGIADAIGADEAAAVYYNLQGMRVDAPLKGRVYIVRRGTHAAKIVY